MQSNALSVEVQERFEKMKSEIVTELEKQLKDMLATLHRSQESKTININESITDANNWLERMNSTKKTTEKIMQENSIWQLLAMSNNLVSSFQTLSDDKKAFRWDDSDLNFEMLFIPHELPQIRLGQLRQTTYANTVICEYGNSNFVKFHFNQEKSVIERTILNFRSSSCAEKSCRHFQSRSLSMVDLSSLVLLPIIIIPYLE